MKLIDFGIQRVGADVTKTIILINSSRKPITLTFDVDSQLKDYEKYYLSVFPMDTFTINPRSRKRIEIRFKPTKRLHEFTKVALKYMIVQNQEVRDLTQITGSCHGIDVKLMVDTLNFDVVVVNSRLTKKLLLQNDGDIPAKFNWDLTFCKPGGFTIKPQRGIALPREDYIFDVTFHPKLEENDITFPKVKCNIKDSKPLYVNLCGSSIPPTKDSVKEIMFETNVQEPTT